MLRRIHRWYASKGISILSESTFSRQDCFKRSCWPKNQQPAHHQEKQHNNNLVLKMLIQVFICQHSKPIGLGEATGTSWWLAANGHDEAEPIDRPKNSGLNFREDPKKIWPNIFGTFSFTYLHFRKLKISHWFGDEKIASISGDDLGTWNWVNPITKSQSWSQSFLFPPSPRETCPPFFLLVRFT